MVDISGCYQPTDGRPAYLRIQAEEISWHEAGREVHDMVGYEVGQYGEAASELVEVSGLSSYNLKLIHETEELWREDGSEDTEEEFGIVSQDNTRQDIAVPIRKRSTSSHM